MLHVGERERKAHRLTVSGCALDQQRFAIERRPAPANRVAKLVSVRSSMRIS
jgi:hypothetical protein